MSDRAAIQQLLAEPCDRFASAVATLASLLIDSEDGRDVSSDTRVASAGRRALHLCIRLLELDAVEARAERTIARTNGNSLADRIAWLGGVLQRDDEQPVAFDELAAIDHVRVERVRAELLDASVALERAGVDDPLGALYESTLARVTDADAQGRLVLLPSRHSDRKRSGAFYTPSALIDHLITQTLGMDGAIESEVDLPRICDPASGSGRFLVAAARFLVEQHASTSASADGTALLQRVIATCMYAVDRDPVAIELTRFRLWAASGFADDVARAVREHCRVGDALLGSPVNPQLGHESADRWCDDTAAAESQAWFHWQHVFPDVFGADPARQTSRAGFDAVLGNPPFLNQLAAATSRSQAAADVIRAWSDGMVRRYTDPAAAFLVRSLDLVRDGGRVSLVLPMSFLASHDTEAVRRGVALRASLRGLWISGKPVFPHADVLTCAPVLIAGKGANHSVRRSVGLPPVHSGDTTLSPSDLATAPSWSFVVSDVLGVPSVVFVGPDVHRDTLASLASATADFRDQYYGLEGFLVDRVEADDTAFPPLVTAGLIDPADCRWGSTPTRVLKQRWDAPRIDRNRMNSSGSLGPWITSRLVPKLLVATQTKVIETVADDRGRLVPSTPVLTVVPRSTSDLWHVAAALTSPVCSAVALRDFGGAALTSETIKLSARQLLTLPLPLPGAAWDAGAEAFREASLAATTSARCAHLTACGAAMLGAYAIAPGTRDGLLRWWVSRLPHRERSV